VVQESRYHPYPVRKDLMIKFLAISVAITLSFAGSRCLAREVLTDGFDLRSMSGFRLTEPSYRAKGDGMDVSVLVCRVIGWAASSPASVHFLRAGPGADALRHHDVRISRMGLRGGENCERVVAHFVGAPDRLEKVTICLAYSHRRCA
jgi:hypothetical protein